MAKQEIYFDGACLPVNPGGIACWGVVAVENGQVLKEKSGIASRKGTNNIAEWTGLIEAIKLAKELGWEKVTVLGDSKLVVNQYNGVWYIHERHLRKLYSKAVSEALNLRLNVIWIRREKNLADPVCHRAFVEEVEKETERRAKRQLGKYRVSKNGSGYIVEKGRKRYTVRFDPLYCTCPYFRKYSSYPLLKRSGIVFRCKHHFIVEMALQRGSSL